MKSVRHLIKRNIYKAIKKTFNVTPEHYYLSLISIEKEVNRQVSQVPAHIYRGYQKEI